MVDLAARGSPRGHAGAGAVRADRARAAELDREARALRADALEKCKREAWAECLEGLDQARGLDPVGDQEPAIGALRAQAAEGLRRDGVVPVPKAVPTGAITPAPTATFTPTQKAAPKPTAATPSSGAKDAPLKARIGVGKKSATPSGMSKSPPSVSEIGGSQEGVARRLARRLFVAPGESREERSTARRCAGG